MQLAWNIALVSCALLFIAFTFVVAFGAPYLPTLRKRVPEALDLIDLKPGQILVELGSGDGRVLAEAARRGITCIGYELNPFLVLYSKVRLIKYHKFTKVIWGNYWHKQWPKAQGIFVFLLQPYMEKLGTKIEQNYPEGIKLVSFAFTIPGKQPVKESNGLYLYRFGKQLKKTRQ